MTAATALPTRIIGIDPGLARVGYGLIDTGGARPSLLDCGILRTYPGRSDGERQIGRAHV